jgi:predicted GNAT family acetyltransferase
MYTITSALNDQGRGAFFIEEGGKRIAEMVIAVDGKNLTVYHTEVSEKLKGQGIASELLANMVAYAREHKLKVIALCPYVLAQFDKHPDQYADVWDQHWHE